MGCCFQKVYGASSVSQPLLKDEHNRDQLSQTDRKWTATLKKEAEIDRKIKKLLLLGPGNSGKSTFFKQLLRIHGEGLLSPKKQYFGQSDMKRAIYDNILDQIRAVIVQCRGFEYKLDDPEEDAISYLETLPSDCEIDQKIAAKIKLIWDNEYIKLSYENRTNLAIVDSCSYFFDALDRISQPDYEPTEEDVLLVRTPTTGIISATFKIDNHTFQLHDAGGQKCERSKWIHCFDNVTAVIFVASLSCFDQGLYESAFVNAMDETLNLWDEILNSRWFRPTSMILFLNKCDLFEYKLEEKKKDLKVCFAEYDGANSYQDGVEYVKLQFLMKNRKQSGHAREIFCHITCATDKNNVKKVFHDVQNIVVNSALSRGGLL
eukprot:146360_1